MGEGTVGEGDASRGLLRALRRGGAAAAVLVGLLPAPGETADCLLLREGFDESRGAWVEADNDTVRLSVEGGAYTMECRRDAGYYVSSPPEEVAGLGDLDLAAVLERRSGSPGHGQGLFWDGLLGETHSFRFLVLHADGTYSLGSRREGKSTYLIQRESSPAVPKGNSRAVVAVRRRGPITRFYVNGVRLAVALSDTPFGGRVGLYVSGPGTTAVDSFEVLESETAPLEPPAAGPGLCAEVDLPAGGGESPAAPCRGALEVLTSAADPTGPPLEEAAALARRSVSLGPGYAPGYVVAARVALERCRAPGDRYDAESVKSEVLPLLRKALALSPDLPEALNASAEAEFALGDLGRAEAALARSLELAPGLWSTHLTLGSYLARTGQPGPARGAWARGVALATRPKDKEAALVHVGRELLRQGDLATATQMLESSVALRPPSPAMLGDRGDLLNRAARQEEARDARLKALEIAESAEVRQRFALAAGTLAKGLLAQGRLEEALSHARSAVAQDGGVEWLHLLLGQICERQGLADEALAAYEAAVSLRQDSFDARRALAQAHGRKASALSGREAAKHRAMALGEYRRALPLAPEANQAREVKREIAELERLVRDW